MRGVRMGKGVWVSRMVYIDELHPEAVTLGDNVTLGLRSTILTHFYWGPRTPHSPIGPVVVESDVFVGPHCLVLPNVRIGRGAVVQAGTVVSKDVPAWTLWGEQKAGPLARVTVPLTHHASYEAFMHGLRPVRGGIKHPLKEQSGSA